MQRLLSASLKHKNTQPSYIFNRENPQNSEPQNGPRRGLDFIALKKWNIKFHEKKNRKFRIREKDVMNSLKVITAAGGQNSVTQMIGSLYDAIEDHYGIFASRLYRAFRPKPLKSTATSSWRKMCCLPYAYIYMVCMIQIYFLYWADFL